MSEPPREEYEQIPWSQLAAEMGSPYRRPALVGVGVVAAVAVGFVFSRVVAGGGPSPAPPEATLPTPVASTVAAETTLAAGTTVTTVPPGQLYREADLLAVLPEEEQRLAAARAEWFVTDYFTVDDVTAEEPEGAQTYVEWAKAFRIDGTDAGRYAVAVAFRLLASGGEGRFERLPLQAVEIAVARTADGGLAVADLPSPIQVPMPGRVPAWPEGGEVPAEVADAVRSRLLGLAIEGEVVSGHEVADGWRVVVRVALAGGAVFPMVVTMPGGGATP